MREFVLTSANATLANALVTMVWVNPPNAPNVNIEFLRFWCGQTGSTTSAQASVALALQSVSQPTTLSNTPQKLKSGDPNASVLVGSTSGLVSTVGTNASAESTGTKTLQWADSFNVLNGWLHVPTPPETRVLPTQVGATTQTGLSFYHSTAPPALTGWNFGAVFREV